MNEPIRIHLLKKSRAIEITAELARQIVALGHEEQSRFMLRQTGQLVAAAQPPTCKQSLQVEYPVADYDPAVSALCGITLRDPDGDPVGLCADDARGIVAAIKAGKVPGVYAGLHASDAVIDGLKESLVTADNNFTAAQQEIGHLSADLAALRAELAAERERVKELHALLREAKPMTYGIAAPIFLQRVDAALAGKDKP